MEKPPAVNPAVRVLLDLSPIFIAGLISKALGQLHPPYYQGVGLLVLGCVAPAFAGCWVNTRSIPRGITAASLLVLGTFLIWIGIVVVGRSTDPHGGWWVFALGGWMFTWVPSLGIFAISLLIQVVWAWVSSPTKTSPEDSVPHDQVAQATSAPEISNGDPYPETATED